jgi:hypothetical protein
MKKIYLAVAGLSLCAHAFAAPVTFAQYLQANNNQDFSVVTTNLGGGNFSVTVTASGLINFTYLVPTLFDGAAQAANLSFTATSTFTGNCAGVTDTTCTQNGDPYTETGFAGSFSITRTTPFGGLSNLLSGTFNMLPVGNPNRPTSGGHISSTIGGSGATYEATQTATNPTQIVFASDFLNFAGVSLEDGTFSMSSVAPPFGVQGNTGNSDGFPNGFTAAASGTFSSAPAPTGSPEPVTTVLLGSALVGLGLLGRKRFAR